MSHSKLKIASELMANILVRHVVHPDFIDILLGFRNAPHASESSSSKISVRNTVRTVGGVDEHRTSMSLESALSTRADRIEMSYQIRYHEDNGTGTRSTRHTAVYHGRSLDPLVPDIMICLQPTDIPGFDKTLEWLVDRAGRNKNVRKDLIADPLLFHQLIFQRYTPGWKVCSRELGTICSQKVS
jgi:hypothetical protein